MSRLSFENLKRVGKRLIIISDFDHTLTNYDSCITHQAFDPKMVVSQLDGSSETLEVVQSNMNSQFSDRLRSVPEEERDQLLTDWWSESHEILCRASISRETVRQSAKFLSFRNDTSDIFKLCEDHNVPFIIVSAGLDAVLKEGLTDLLGHMPRNVEVVANQMIFDATDRLISFGPIIHTENKSDHLWRRSVLMRESGDRTIVLLGDTDEDLTVIDHRISGNSYSISVNPKKEMSTVPLPHTDSLPDPRIRPTVQRR